MVAGLRSRYITVFPHFMIGAFGGAKAQLRKPDLYEYDSRSFSSYLNRRYEKCCPEFGACPAWSCREQIKVKPAVWGAERVPKTAPAAAIFLGSFEGLAFSSSVNLNLTAHMPVSRALYSPASRVAFLHYPSAIPSCPRRCRHCHRRACLYLNLRILISLL
jgi:hypothetical protein